MPKPPSKRSRKARLAHVLDRGRLVLAPRARTLVRSGFDLIADALSPTLGPTARTVLVERMNRWDPPEISDDAATIARRIVELPLYRNTGGMLLRHVVWRVLDQVGDGTATTAVIAQSLLRETTRQIAAGANPAVLRKGIDDGLVQALEALDSLAVPVDTLEALRSIALGAGHDEAVADRIAEIHDKHGWDITICIQEWLANELAVEVVDGWKWDSGFASSEFVTAKERGLAWAESPFLLFTNVFLESAEQVVPILQQVSNAVEDLGFCDRVWASRDFFAVIGGDGEEEDILERAAIVRSAIESEDAPYDRALLRKRLGYLTGGVATLSIGAATKTEMIERKARAERAVKAVESGRREGVVAGGGVALIACAAAIDTCCPELPLDERLGRIALARALEEPLRTIVANSGAEPEPIAHAVRQGHGKVAYDAVRGELVDPIEAGILDPINVIRAAMRNGVSAAVMAMLTEALVIPRYRYLHADPKP